MKKKASIICHLTEKYLQFKISRDQKFVNLQYNMLVRWADGTNDSLTKCLMFQVLFFISINLAKFFAKTFLYKITKMKIKNFECLKSMRNYEKKMSETWSMSRLSHRPSKPAYYIVNCRISIE